MRYSRSRAFRYRPMRTGKRTRITCKTIQTIHLHESPFVHTFRLRQTGSFQNPNRMLLRIDILFRDHQIIIITHPSPQIHQYLNSSLFSPQYRTRPFSNSHGISRSIAMFTKNGLSFHQQLIVRYQPRTYIYDIYTIQYSFRTRNRFEILTFGNNSPRDSRVISIRDRFQQHVRRHDWYRQTAHPVCLHGETTFFGHPLNNRLHVGPRLHQLVRSQVTDISGSNSQYILPQQRKFVIHHFLNNSRRVHPGQIIVFKSRHKRYGPRGHNQIVCIHEKHGIRFQVFHSHSFPLQNIPNRRIQVNAFHVLPRQGFGNIKSAHTAKTLFFLEKEELVGLHIKLTTNLIVIINHDIIYSIFFKFFPYG